MTELHEAIRINLINECGGWKRNGNTMRHCLELIYCMYIYIYIYNKWTIAIPSGNFLLFIFSSWYTCIHLSVSICVRICQWTCIYSKWYNSLLILFYFSLLYIYMHSYVHTLLYSCLTYGIWSFIFFSLLFYTQGTCYYVCNCVHACRLILILILVVGQ